MILGTPREPGPTGDKTSDDPNDDDDAWDDLDGDYNPEVPIPVCVWELSPYRCAPARTPATPAVPIPPTHLSRQRLRG
jgi:hypothetical protein